jgi:hypothetical protein
MFPECSLNVQIPRALALVMVMLEWYATSLYESEESCLCVLMTRARQTQREGRSWQRFWQVGPHAHRREEKEALKGGLR